MFLSFIIVLIVAIFALTVCAEAPTIRGITRPYSWQETTGIYYMQGEDISVATSYMRGTPTSAKVYWLDTEKATLSVSEGYDGISGTFTPNANDFVWGIYNGEKLYESPGNIKVEISNAAGTSFREKAGYVTASNYSLYTGIDSSFSYEDEWSNDFYAIATTWQNGAGTYNCLAYAIDDYTEWRWPWGSSPSMMDIAEYMLGLGEDARTYGTIYDGGCSVIWTPFETKVIYYSGGHFAKVVSYTSEGAPLKIMSKWGSAELILSDSYDPFISEYGDPLYYIH